MNGKTDRKSNLILIGMPGSGKSTIGVLLAKRLGMSFCDTDLLLQRRTGKRLAELLAERGKQGFIEVEGAMLAAWSGRSTVVATGGSAIYTETGMAGLRKDGWILYIEVPAGELERRIGLASDRGIAALPGQTLSTLLEERSPLYERHADHTAHWREGMAMEDMVREISEAWLHAFDP